MKFYYIDNITKVMLDMKCGSSDKFEATLFLMLYQKI